jgi:hypothetical protein
MIRFISYYFYDLNRNRIHYLTGLERRRAFRLVCAITFCVTISVLLWILY